MILLFNVTSKMSQMFASVEAKHYNHCMTIRVILFTHTTSILGGAVSIDLTLNLCHKTLVDSC